MTSAALSLLAIGSGCSASVATVGPQHVRNHTDVAQLGAGPYVPAGTRFVATLEHPIDTQHSAPGQPFTAVVQDELRSVDGRVIVPQGAVLRGTLASVGSAMAPSVRVRLDSVDTVAGPARIDAAIRHAEHRHYPGPTQASVGPVDYFDDPYFYGWSTSYGGLGGPAPYGGGPWSSYGEGYGYRFYSPVETRVPRGAQLRLVLTRPLALPGSSVAPR